MYRVLDFKAAHVIRQGRPFFHERLGVSDCYHQLAEQKARDPTGGLRGRQVGGLSDGI